MHNAKYWESLWEKREFKYPKASSIRRLELVGIKWIDEVYQGESSPTSLKFKKKQNKFLWLSNERAFNHDVKFQVWSRTLQSWVESFVNSTFHMDLKISVNFQ